MLSRFALCQLESLPTSRYLLPPRLLLDVSAKQLSGYGGSLDAATTDITHYLTAGFGVLVLCGGAVRCRNMQEFLQRRHIPAALALEGDTVPAPGQTLVSVGALSAGSEWPALKLAVLTEGQLTRAPVRQGQKAPPTQVRQPPAAAELRRPGGGRPGGPHPPRNRPLCRDDPPAGGRRGEGLHQDTVRRE